MTSSSQQLDDFAQEARTFCGWASGADGTAMTAPVALRRIVSLYAAALNLPPPLAGGTADAHEDEAVELPPDVLDVTTARAAGLPVQVYWEIFDPLDSGPEEPVAGLISDDIGDIYKDVARGLVRFDSGRREEALWEWAFNFQIHWGAHATSALRALHAYLAGEKPDDLLSVS